MSVVRRTNSRISYVDRTFDRETRKTDRRTRYVATPLPFQDDPLVRRPKLRYNNPGVEEMEPEPEPRQEKQKFPIPYDVTQENKFELINRIMCPLHIVTYENQLKIKYTGMKNLLQDYGRRVKMTPSSCLVVDGHGLPCPLQFTKKSPKQVEYRNKDEFSLWTGVDGIPKTVGFFIGEISHHSNVVCVEPDNLIISKKSHRKLASHFQHYLRNISKLDVCYSFSEGGNWRRFVVRSNEDGEHMIIAHLHPQELTPDQLEEEKGRITEYFQGLADEMNIKSAYIQIMRTSQTPPEENPYQLLFGDACLHETVLEKQFVISPDSFFQTNTLAAEVLYNTVMDELELKKDMTVIDLCSGTGTMAILIAPHVRRVIGVETNMQAVADANKNAELNGVKNVTFVRGTVEDVLPSLSEQLFGQKVAVIANPGRAGLRSSVISTIRDTKQITKLVYIACKPAGDALKNFFHLTIASSPSNPGSPLLPMNATPVDMFPQTDHVELVMTFERFV